MLSLRRAFTVAGVAASVAAISLIGGNAYAAGSGNLVYTTDGDPGGSLYWAGDYSGTTEFWNVCDNQADGYGVDGTVSWSGNSQTIYATGGNGKCTDNPSGWNLAEGTKVTLRVCLIDSNYGEHYCHSVSASA